MTTSLDIINRRFAALEAAWKTQAGTKQVNAGFASVRAAIDAAKAHRKAYLGGPFTPVPLSARAERALYLAPEAMAPAAVDEAEAVEVSPRVTCPRCLGPADWADVQRIGCCYDCGNAGHGRAQEPTSAAIGSAATDTLTPPSGDSAAPEVAAGVGVSAGDAAGGAL